MKEGTMIAGVSTGTVAVVAGYALCSSLLAVVNKYAITYFPYPALLTALQYLTSVVVVKVASWTGMISHDRFLYDTAKKFFPAAFVFYLAIFANTNLLKHANVDTFIVFRSTTPLLVAIADTLFRNQPFPSKWTLTSLFVILGGAVAYVATDSQFSVTAYSWAVAYLVVICTEMVYVKKMVTDIALNTWGFVFYNNLISLLLSPLFCFLMGDYKMLLVGAPAFENRYVSFVSVGLSCLFGVAISFFGFAARKAVSATAFTVTGVVNKLLTVVVNLLIWDKHASNLGLASLLVTIVGGFFYQQSTTTTTAPSITTSTEAAARNSDEEKGLLLEKDADQYSNTK